MIASDDGMAAPGARRRSDKGPGPVGVFLVLQPSPLYINKNAERSRKKRKETRRERT